MMSEIVEKGLEDRKDKFGISEREAREMYERMRMKYPEFPIKEWEKLTKKELNN